MQHPVEWMPALRNMSVIVPSEASTMTETTKNIYQGYKIIICIKTVLHIQ